MNQLHQHSAELKLEGLQQALAYPLFQAIFHRRSRRISKGIRSVAAGSLSYHSDKEPQPLEPLEEALLVAATGATGVTLPDMPFESESGKPLLGSPMLEIGGRTAGSPDNAQATHFFLVNDSGTYLLRQPHDSSPFLLSGSSDSAEQLIKHVEACKIKILDHRLDLPRRFPAYIGRNRYVSNVPGSTILIPVVDMTRQYINGIMFLLSQEPGLRPTFIDDWNFYRPAGVRKWIKSGFLNKDLPLPLGYLGTFRIHVEADLLLQNLMLVLQAMGLGGWIHAGFAAPYLLGDPDFAGEFGPGLGFRFHRPKKRIRWFLRFLFPIPTWRANPVGLDGILETYAPPYYETMSDAVDAILRHKYGPQGLYRNSQNFREVFRPGLETRFVEEVPHHEPEVIEVTKAVCTYIYRTYGRFPAHVDAVFVPGIWLQAHHLDLDYYDQLYRSGYAEVHARHDYLWHARTSTPASSIAIER